MRTWLQMLVLCGRCAALQLPPPLVSEVVMHRSAVTIPAGARLTTSGVFPSVLEQLPSQLLAGWGKEFTGYKTREYGELSVEEKERLLRQGTAPLAHV